MLIVAAPQVRELRADDPALALAQARAIQRCGELLEQIPRAKTGPKLDDGTDIELTRAKAATDAGLSDRQRVTALRVARVPKPEFAVAFESAGSPASSSPVRRVPHPRPSWRIFRLRIGGGGNALILSGVDAHLP